jgi:cell division initiation protein
MAQITPSELSEREFTRSIRGYNTAEVDEYINRIVENYAKLYRENIELSKRLEEMEAGHLSSSNEEELIRNTLETAKKAGDTIVEDAYNRADEILASVKSGCDSILRNFRDKVEAQKTALSEIQQTVLSFKNELFEKYRLHIELIEQISPIYEYEEELSPEQYVSHVVSDLKREVAAQYDISLDTLSTPGADTVVAESDNAPTVEMTTAKDELLAIAEAAKGMASADKAKKKKEAIPSVERLLNESDDSDMKAYKDDSFEKTAQFSLKTDAAITAERPSFK